MLTVNDVQQLPRPELAALLRRGHPIEASALDDSEYGGVSLGLPSFVDKLAWKKFTKVFHRDPQSGTLRGWNVRVEQNGLLDPWVAQRRNGEPHTFGHFRVVDAAAYPSPPGCDRGLLIHYGLGGNARLDPVSRLRDPIVAVNADSSDLLLGWSYVDLGWKRLPTPSYFTLQRLGPLSHRVTPPRG